MPELQIKLIKVGIVGLLGITLLQAITIRRLIKNYERGQRRFDNLHEGTTYLLNVLEERDVDLSDFDVIALTAILEGES